jgi:hypothetical protein
MVVKYTNVEAKWNEFLHIQIMEPNIEIHTLNEISDHHDFNTTFFVESSNAGYLNPRQSCSVEAAARAQYPHPIVIYMTGVKEEKMAQQNDWIKNLTNVRLVHLDTKKFFTNDNLGRIYEEVKSTSSHKVEHVSDLARIALLKKFGGLYIDLDAVLMKSTAHLNSFLLKNFANGILKFRKGHPIIEALYHRLNETKFNPMSWIGLGEELIRKVVVDTCNFTTNNFEEASLNCNVTFLNKEYFLPVFWGEWKDLFGKDIELETFKPEVMKPAYAIEFSNFLTSNIPIIKGRRQLFEQVMKKYCPSVYHTMPKFY